MNTDKRIALVTGGRRGIGRAIAQVLAEQGRIVIIADRQTEETEITSKEISDATGQITKPVFIDVADRQSVFSAIESILVEYGRIDILINNAGITRDTLIMRMDEKDWDEVININLKGAFNCSQAVIRSMIKQRYGRIINISSVSGLVGQAGQTNYSASKAGLVGFTKALAREVASRGITVNAVAPGFVPTELTKNLPKELVDTMMKLIPMNRWGQPREIANAVAFLSSDEASYITGQVLSVDGGMMMV